MKGMIAWFASNPVAANLLMALLVVGGITSLPTIPKRTFPDIDIPVIRISVEYLGAAPEEVEEGVCVRIEEAIDGIQGIEQIRSTAIEGVCGVSAELIVGTDETRALADIKNRVDAITTFPNETEKPITAQVTMIRPVVDLALHGDIGERALRELGQRVRDDLAALPGITQVELLGVRPYEISIEVSEVALRRYGLTFDQVAAAVRGASLDLPGGSIKTVGGEILLRTKGQAYRGPEFERLVLLTRPDGTYVRVGDIATVIDGFEDIDRWSTFDGKPAVIVRVSRVGDQSVLAIAERVKRFAESGEARLPETVALTVWQDQTVPLVGRLQVLYQNGRAGFVLVFLVLALFLRMRLAFWVALGVPVAFAGALFLMGPLGISIDVISLFSFILVLGILVDDAIVVGESVHTWQERTGDRRRGAITGTQRVVVPVVFGVLTTVAAFSPMMLLEGPMGQVFGVLAGVTVACLLFSLVESLLVLPSHLAHGHETPAARREGRWARLQSRFASSLDRFIRGPYTRALGLVLSWRYAMAATSITLLVLSVAVVNSGRLRFSFFPPVEADVVTGLITMPQGIPAERTALAAQQLVDAAERLRAELDPEYAAEGSSLIEHRMVSIGAQPFRESEASNSPGGGSQADRSGSHLAEVVLALIPAEERKISTREVEKRWRTLTGPVAEAVEVSFFSSIFSPGEAINLQLQSRHIDHLVQAADRVKVELAQVPGVLDIADSFRAGKREVKLDILPAAETLGLARADLARQVRQAFYGEEVQRVQRGRDDVRVMVRFPESERRSLGSLETMRIRTADGAEVPFGTVAVAQFGRGYSAIRRTDRQRVVNVTADVDRNVITEGAVLAHLREGPLPAILADYPDMSMSLEGGQREQSRTAAGLFRWYPVALFGIYALLAIPLRSYFQPLLIMSVIPFGMVGAFFGHLVMGRDLSMMSVIGIVALSGVVVNASLVLVHFVNGRRLEGVALEQAVHEASIERFRPIVLTAATTFVGLTPLMLERSVQAQFLLPMAISIAFGVLFATTITLFVVPGGYLILEDFRALPTRLRATLSRRRAGRTAASQPGVAPGLPSVSRSRDPAG
ncbi:efflux RND transporter permease subunit [Myxococcota bacterium]|nr:efflux RND transporter permease subunit [Myxococcota bacterium]